MLVGWSHADEDLLCVRIFVYPHVGPLGLGVKSSNDLCSVSSVITL